MKFKKNKLKVIRVRSPFSNLKRAYNKAALAKVFRAETYLLANVSCFFYIFASFRSAAENFTSFATTSIAGGE